MLVRFGVSNYKSIKDYQEISLAASSLKDDLSYLIEVDKFQENLLPVLGLYGANASGKSNLLMAFEFLVQGILSSHTKGDVEGGVPSHPFLLDPIYEEKPSTFDCDVIIEGIRYHYGYSLNRKEVIQEWLYAYTEGIKRIWFHRSIDDKQQYYFGKFLKGKNKTIQEFTRRNSLYLSVAAQNNHEQLGKVYNYFKNNFLLQLAYKAVITSRTIKYFENSEIANKVMEFLKYADAGISGYAIHTDEMPDKTKQMMGELETVILQYASDLKIRSSFSPMSRKTLHLEHVGKDKTNISFNSRFESRGTLTLVEMLGPIFDALENGKTLFVDELDTSLHPLLSIKLLKLFQSSKNNKKGAQLIFTTHDTNLISSDVLRRDEIWFSEKGPEGATHFYPLTDIRTRKADNIKKGYLQGRFGAIPFLGNLDDLFD